MYKYEGYKPCPECGCVWCYEFMDGFKCGYCNNIFDETQIKDPLITEENPEVAQLKQKLVDLDNKFFLAFEDLKNKQNIYRDEMREKLGELQKMVDFTYTQNKKLKKRIKNLEALLSYDIHPD